MISTISEHRYIVQFCCNLKLDQQSITAGMLIEALISHSSPAADGLRPNPAFGVCDDWSLFK